MTVEAQLFEACAKLSIHTRRELGGALCRLSAEPKRYGCDARTVGCLLMRGSPPTEMLAAVSVQQPVRVLVEVQPTGGTILGRVPVGDSALTRFYGWLELIDEIDRATAPQSGATDAKAEGVQ
jgi:hypothetical protein